MCLCTCQQRCKRCIFVVTFQVQSLVCSCQNEGVCAPLCSPTAASQGSSCEQASASEQFIVILLNIYCNVFLSCFILEGPHRAKPVLFLSSIWEDRGIMALPDLICLPCLYFKLTVSNVDDTMTMSTWCNNWETTDDWTQLHERQKVGI